MQECEKQMNEVGISEEVEGTERNGFNILLEVFCFTYSIISHY